MSKKQQSTQAKITAPQLTKAIKSGEKDGEELAYRLIDDAVQAHATDLHINPQSDGYEVRFRVAKQLYPVSMLSVQAGETLVRAIEVSANIDLVTQAERTGGSAYLGTDETPVRVTTTVTARGSKLSLRMLEASHTKTSIRDLGMRKEDERLLTDWAHHAEGMMLCVGPTGCGKTTTSYALLKEMRKTRNILTVEDPVEYTIDGISQIAINKGDRHLPESFATGVRSILRHDPDVIFLGEIRDHEAARAAIHASFSGHVLMSTMHSRDPASSITLLRSMGINDYEIAASLKIVLGQRILRLLCKNCKEKRGLTDSERQLCDTLDISIDETWSAKGCDQCSDTGYRGMSAIFELWQLNTDDYSSILAHEDESIIRASLRERQIKPLAASALEKAQKGDIDLSEALSVNFANYK